MGRVAITFFAASLVLATALGMYLGSINIEYNPIMLGLESLLTKLIPGFSYSIGALAFIIWFLFVFSIMFSLFVILSARTLIALTCSLGFFGVLIFMLTGDMTGAFISLTGAVAAGYFK